MKITEMDVAVQLQVEPAQAADRDIAWLDATEPGTRRTITLRVGDISREHTVDRRPVLVKEY